MDDQVLLPRVEALRAGDVVLTANRESTGANSGKMSGAIRRATHGRFSHALICSEPPALIEAVFEGVSVVSLARCFVHDRWNVRVLRHPDTGIAKRAAEFAQLEVGRDYSWKRAVQSIFDHRTIDLVRDHGIFCSALVAQAYLAAGAPEFRAKAVDKTTPATLDEMDGLLDVTDVIFRRGPIPNNAATMTALDGDSAPTLSAAQTEISNRYAKSVLPAAKAIARHNPELGLSVTPTMFGIIDLVLRAHDAAAALPAARRAAVGADLDALDSRLGDLIGSGELERLFQRIQAADGENYDAAWRESFQVTPNIDAAAMAGLLEATRRQLSVRRSSWQGLTEWNAGRSRAAAAYLAVEAKVIENLAAREPLFQDILRRIK